LQDGLAYRVIRYRSNMNCANLREQKIRLFQQFEKKFTVKQVNQIDNINTLSVRSTYKNVNMQRKCRFTICTGPAINVFF